MAADHLPTTTRKRILKKGINNTTTMIRRVPILLLLLLLARPCVGKDHNGNYLQMERNHQQHEERIQKRMGATKTKLRKLAKKMKKKKTKQGLRHHHMPSPLLREEAVPTTTTQTTTDNDKSRDKAKSIRGSVTSNSNNYDDFNYDKDSNNKQQYLESSTPLSEAASRNLQRVQRGRGFGRGRGGTDNEAAAAAVGAGGGRVADKGAGGVGANKNGGEEKIGRKVVGRGADKAVDGRGVESATYEKGDMMTSESVPMVSWGWGNVWVVTEQESNGNANNKKGRGGAGNNDDSNGDNGESEIAYDESESGGSSGTVQMGGIYNRPARRPGSGRVPGGSGSPASGAGNNNNGVGGGGTSSSTSSAGGGSGGESTSGGGSTGTSTSGGSSTSSGGSAGTTNNNAEWKDQFQQSVPSSSSNLDEFAPISPGTPDKAPEIPRPAPSFYYPTTPAPSFQQQPETAAPEPVTGATETENDIDSSGGAGAGAGGICHLCSDESTATLLTRTLIATTVTCQDIATALAAAPEAECAAQKALIPVDVESYCGCAGKTYTGACTFCPAGMDNIWHNVTIPSLNDWTCEDAEVYAGFITNQASCAEMAAVSDACCGTWEEYWAYGDDDTVAADEDTTGV